MEVVVTDNMPLDIGIVSSFGRCNFFIDDQKIVHTSLRTKLYISLKRDSVENLMQLKSFIS
ncbi:hypothetical protein NIES4071_34890 [Calothrix sp. NIES-4071]|nr:hypothetical protein NIES4071_34890 [Calothrix sp. NIES-4071]BAZ57808.1 hypothetical protein NIES4105_34820 [Calothrix sp. NIES-4105]